MTMKNNQWCIEIMKMKRNINENDNEWKMKRNEEWYEWK